MRADAGGMRVRCDQRLAKRVLMCARVRRRHETRSHDTVLLSHKLSEYHSGYRGFTCQVLKDPPLTHNLDDFLFDNEMLSQAIPPRLSHQ
jgi:hypothetical protein